MFYVYSNYVLESHIEVLWGELLCVSPKIHTWTRTKSRVMGFGWQTSIPSIKFYFCKKKITSFPSLMNSTLQLFDLLKLCCNDDIFVPVPWLWSWLVHASDQSKQMLTIVDSNALVVKDGMKSSSLLECTQGNKRIKVTQWSLCCNNKSMIKLQQKPYFP